MNNLNLYEAKVTRGGRGFSFKEVYYFLIIADSLQEASSYSYGIQDLSGFELTLVANSIAVGRHSRIVSKNDASVYHHAERVEQG